MVNWLSKVKRLLKEGLLDKFKKMDLTHFQICGIDNLLCKVCDPMFIGWSINNKYDLSFKTIKKQYPEEKVGVHAIVDDKITVIGLIKRIYPFRGLVN